MPHQVVFMNGPPRSGKDLAGLFITEEIPSARELKMSEPLKMCVSTLFGVSFADVRRWEAHGNTEKEMPQAQLHNMSWREALIWMSESCVKPRLGETFFGDTMVRRLQEPTSTTLSVITDVGFQDEVMPIITTCGVANCHLFRLHRDGCVYAGDSRGYLFRHHPPIGLHIEDINNNHDPQMFKIQVMRRINKIIGRKQEFRLI